MNHAEYQEQVSLHVDGVLDDKSTASLFAHLADCEECRSLLRMAMHLREHMSEQDLATVPSSLDQRILVSLPARRRTAKGPAWYAPVWFTRISVPLPAAASIVFLIIVGSLLFSPLLLQEQKREAEIPRPFVDRIPLELQTTFNPNR